MRNTFIKYLIKQAELNNNIFLLCGDLGYSVLEPFAERFPDRYLNVGIAEQNMVGVAAGLALSGKKVFTYSIVNFAVARCLEQIRNDICYHNLDVTVVSVGGGLPYGSQGYTHLGVEDIAFTRNLPNMKVFVPADKSELDLCMNKINKQAGPSYLRLGRGGEPDIHNNKLYIENNIIELIPPNQTTDTIILGTGSILKDAQLALQKLKQSLEHNNLNIGLVSLPEISDNNRLNLTEYLNKNKYIKKIITLEEHLIYGGFGGFVAETLSMVNHNINLTMLGVKHQNIKNIGDQKYLKQQNGIDSDSILNFLINACCKQEDLII